MSSVIKRTPNSVGVYEFRQSVNTPDFDPVEWLINPDTSLLVGVPTIYWKVVVDNVEEMTAAEKSAVDVAHDPPSLQFIASSKLVDRPFSVAQVNTWEEIGGAVTTPSFFTPDYANCIGRVTGMICTTGAGAELRVIENSASASNVQVGQFVVPDTGGVWQMFGFMVANQPPAAGTNEYVLQGKLASASALSIKAASVSLLQKVGMWV
jgi:hypothetical protein